MTRVPGMYAEHLQLRATRRALPRAARRLERWRAALKPREYRAERRKLELIASSVPALVQLACERTEAQTW